MLRFGDILRDNGDAKPNQPKPLMMKTNASVPALPKSTVLLRTPYTTVITAP